MSLTSRKRRPIARDEGKLRDTRLFVVATEDRYAPKQYFGFLHHNRIHVEVLETTDTRSSPAAVVERLLAYMEQYQVGKDDQLWALLDTDHWTDRNHVRELKNAIRKAKLKGCHVAMSNPCFDLWLLLHFEDVSSKAVFERCDDVAKRIRDVAGAFNKTRLKPQDYPLTSIESAIRRAKDLERSGKNPEQKLWPAGPGTRVYLLMEELKKAGLVLMEPSR